MSNPYELRFSMLMEARTILVEEYEAKVQALMEKYHALKDSGEAVDFPVLPEYPTFEMVENLCKRMNSFVSSK